MSQFKTRLYDIYLLIAPPEAPRLWQWDSWMKAVPALTPVVTSPRGRTSARITQLARRAGSPYQSAVRFGQLGWNERSHAAWTHGSPGTRDVSPQWTFHRIEFWAPGPTTCENEECPPDTFFALASKDMRPFPSGVGYGVALAVAQDSPSLKSSAAAALSALREIMRPTLAAQTARVWGGGHYPGTTTWFNAIQDTFFATGPFKPGMHGPPPSIAAGHMGAAVTVTAATRRQCLVTGCRAGAALPPCTS